MWCIVYCLQALIQVFNSIMMKPISNATRGTDLRLNVDVLRIAIPDRDKAQEFLFKLRPSLQKELMKIEQALSKEDWQVIYRCAHNIRSASAYLGIMGISALAQRLEVLAQARAAPEEITESWLQLQLACLSYIKQPDVALVMLLNEAWIG